MATKTIKRIGNLDFAETAAANECFARAFNPWQVWEIAKEYYKNEQKKSKMTTLKTMELADKVVTIAKEKKVK